MNQPPTLEQVAQYYASNPQAGQAPAAQQPQALANYGPPPGFQPQAQPQQPPAQQSFGPPPGFPPQAPAQQTFGAPPGFPQQAPVGNVPAHMAPQLVAVQQSQPAPINPPEAAAALQPNAPPPVERKRGRGRAKSAAAGTGAAADSGATESGADSLAEAILNLAALLPKGSSLTVAGEG